MAVFSVHLGGLCTHAHKLLVLLLRIHGLQSRGAKEIFETAVAVMPGQLQGHRRCFCWLAHVLKFLAAQLRCIPGLLRAGIEVWVLNLQDLARSSGSASTGCIHLLLLRFSI